MKVILVLLLAIAADAASVAKEAETLRLVHVFFRHGSRTPELKHTYPEDPYGAETFWPWGYGGLTNKGKQMSFKLGQLLRDRYNTFLGDIYTPELILGTSTDYDRTKMTLIQVLAGLFPPSPIQTWNESIPWMPIPIHYDKDRYDYTLRRPLHYCPTYFKELEGVMASEEVQSDLKSYRNLFKYLEEHTKLNITTFMDVFGVYQTLCAEDVMNFTLPDWTKSVYPDKVHEIAAKQCYLENSNPILKRLNGGRMLSKIIKQMLDKSSGALVPSERKIYLYSGHENNVINILAALNLFNPHVPKYTASVIVELHYLEEISGYGVKVLYVKDAYSQPKEQKLEGCEVLCPLNNFIRITQPHVPVNYTAECHSHIKLD